MGTIRLLLALSVVLNHSEPLPLTGNELVGGKVAVQCFFIISGFYMAMILNNGYTHLPNFYFNRFIRIFPTYWLVLALTLIGPHLIGRADRLQTIADASYFTFDTKVLMIFANLFIFGSDIMMFLFQS